MDDALTIIKHAVDRGVGQVDLVRAAAACLRSVAPRASWSQAEVLAALNAVERWTATPSASNADLALRMVPNLEGLEEKDPEDVDVCLLVASAMAVLSAASNNVTTLTAILAVEQAGKVAARVNIDLAPVVTAELL
jgi:CBS domain-containing protein